MAVRMASYAGKKGLTRKIARGRMESMGTNQTSWRTFAAVWTGPERIAERAFNWFEHMFTTVSIHKYMCEHKKTVFITRLDPLLQPLQLRNEMFAHKTWTWICTNQDLGSSNPHDDNEDNHGKSAGLESKFDQVYVFLTDQTQIYPHNHLHPDSARHTSPNLSHTLHHDTLWYMKNDDWNHIYNDCFYDHSWRSTVVIASGTLSSFEQYVCDCVRVCMYTRPRNDTHTPTLAASLSAPPYATL